MIDQLSIPLSGAGLTCAALYLTRLNALHPGMHLPRCIGAQSLGFVAACWVFGATASIPEWAQWLNLAALCVMLIHLGATSARWDFGAPPEYESRPMPLDGIHQ